jgi:hypothetical protein
MLLFVVGTRPPQDGIRGADGTIYFATSLWRGLGGQVEFYASVPMRAMTVLALLLVWSVEPRKLLTITILRQESTSWSGVGIVKYLGVDLF